ncbi:hypothetical protein GCM10020000_35690 [Streptomyces olivoverticillatus]
MATAVAVWNVLRDRRTKSDGIEVEPLVPAEEEIFGGVILGDVPYSVEGFNVIVAGPDGLASTPDPTANIARRPVPPTLEVVRVRPSYRSDPVQAVPGSHVAECRDGETTVLIVVDSKKTCRGSSERSRRADLLLRRNRHRPSDARSEQQRTDQCGHDEHGGSEEHGERHLRSLRRRPSA